MDVLDIMIEEFKKRNNLLIDFSWADTLASALYAVFSGWRLYLFINIIDFIDLGAILR